MVTKNKFHVSESLPLTKNIISRIEIIFKPSEGLRLRNVYASSRVNLSIVFENMLLENKRLFSIKEKMIMITFGLR